MKVESPGGLRSTIGLRVSTKKKLDMNRAPGQCYDGFLCQLVEMWEETRGTNGKEEKWGR
jgi:hypothetical protein